MMNFIKELPDHERFYFGEEDLFIEKFVPEGRRLGSEGNESKPPILFLHGAFSGSWMWSRYIPHFLEEGWTCFSMNLRGHYFSRVQDMTKLTFQDYLSDVRDVIKMVHETCGIAPVLIGHSLGGILGQKIAEEGIISGLTVIDSSASREVFNEVPYEVSPDIKIPLLIPAPIREKTSMDESEEEVAFQVKYLTSESAKVLGESSFAYGAKEGISIDGGRISCPTLVINAVNEPLDRRRGAYMATCLHGEYVGLENTSHTGLLVGQRYKEVAAEVLKWLSIKYNA